MSRKLEGCTILRKGLVDIVTNGDRAFMIGAEASKKRCGGMGDVLSGVLGSFVGFDCESKFKLDGKEFEIDSELLAAASASLLVRNASKLAYEEKGHAVICTDVIEKLI